MKVSKVQVGGIYKKQPLRRVGTAHRLGEIFRELAEIHTYAMFGGLVVGSSIMDLNANRLWWVSKDQLNKYFKTLGLVQV